MRVVDLFCGSKGWSRPFKDRGHDIWTTDINPVFEPDLVIDFMDLSAEHFPWKPDIILASPPCETFSTMTMYKNWSYEGEPKTEKARVARELIQRLESFISPFDMFVIENPRARLRTLPFAPAFERRTVWYCRLGGAVAKPTDLWGKFPKNLILPAECHNGNLDHIAAPRRSHTGTQGFGTPALRAKIPYGLGLTICLAIEEDKKRDGKDE